MLVLKQTRRCDGSCCKESPRFPNRDGTDCIYHVSPYGKESSGCELMIDPSLIPPDTEKSYAFPERGAKEVYIETCFDWPQNTLPAIGKTGDCCWQWVDE